MTATTITFYALSAAVLLLGAVAVVIGHRQAKAQRLAADARLAKRLRQVESDRARFGGAL